MVVQLASQVASSNHDPLTQFGGKSDPSRREDPTLNCLLCGKNEAIENSHIIPSFVFKWMKATAPTEYLRTTETPRQRVQDGHKGPYLCLNCEGRFGKWENHFSEGFFQALIVDPTLPAPEPELDDGARKCVLSIMWRSVIHLQFRAESTSNTLEHADFAALDLAQTDLESAIEGHSNYRLNFMHLTPSNVDAFHLPLYRRNAYLYDRGACEDTRVMDDGVTVFLKLPRALFWIHTSREIGSHVKDLPVYDLNDLTKVNGFLNSLVHTLGEARAGMSLKQIEKVRRAIRADKADADWSRSAQREVGDDPQTST